MKYQSLEEVLIAHVQGELTPDDYLVLDNDCSFLYDREGNLLFDGGGPDQLLRDALNLLGIPWEFA